MSSSADRWLHDALAGRRTLAFLELTRDEQAEVRARIRAGLRHADTGVRGLAWRAAEGVAVALMDVQPCGPHLVAEIEAGRVLAPGAPVPGCRCARCTGRFPRLHAAPDTRGIVCPQCHQYRDLVRDERAVFYACEACRTSSAAAWSHRAAGDYPEELPVAHRPAQRAWSSRPAPLNVDAARGIPILEVARRLGLEVDRHGWARCPFHGDSRPSLHLNARKGAAFCNPCGRSWDAIALYQALRGLGFAEAVRELAA